MIYLFPGVFSENPVVLEASIARGGDAARSECLIEVADLEQVMQNEHRRMSTNFEPMVNRSGDLWICCSYMRLFFFF